MGICGSATAATNFVWGKGLVHVQPEPNHPDIYHTPSGKDIICFHIHPDHRHVPKTVKPQSGSHELVLHLASRDDAHSAFLANKISSSSLIERTRTHSDLQLDLKKPERGQQNVPPVQPVSMFTKRESFMSSTSNSNDRFRTSSVCSRDSSEPSHSATCFDLLCGSYKTVHEYEITARPFGMRIVDGKVTLVKGAASKAGIRPGDELQKIDKDRVCAKTWAAKFTTISVPFTITLMRFHCGSSSACSTSPNQGYGYDTETGMVRMTSRVGGQPEKGETLFSSYSPYNIIAGRISRHRSPHGAKSNASHFPPTPSDEKAASRNEGSESNHVSTSSKSGNKDVPQTGIQPPKIKISKKMYVPESIYAGRLCRQKSPHKSKHHDKATPTGLEDTSERRQSTPPKPKAAIMPQEPPSCLSDMLSDITLTG